MRTPNSSTFDAFPPGVESRPYQQRIVAQAIALFIGGAGERSLSSVMIESPTGSGKTVMGLAVARHLQCLGLTVGWAAMRRNLLTQAQAENERFGFGVDLRPISMFDKTPPKVDLLVIDEAQHDGALSMANLHSFIRPTKILGLSATPFRADKVKLCFERWLRDAGIHRLIADGYLSPFRHYTLPAYTPEAVADAYAREPGRWGRSLMFFHTLRECQRCMKRLTDLGVRAELVTATTDRERQIADLAAGRCDVIVNMLLLAEGFDCPTLKTVFCRPSGRSCTVQMAGRVLRRHADVPVKQIVQCAETRHPFPRTATPIEQYLWSDDAGEWRSLTTNATLDAIARRMQELIARSTATLPALVAEHAARGVEAGIGTAAHWRRRRGTAESFAD